jgi:threonine aldolase
MLADNVWLKYASQANRMAKLMHELVSAIPGVKILFPVEANAVFVDLPKPAIEAMWAKGWMFYNFIGEGGCRLMCSWDTTEEDVRAFAADLAATVR